MGTAPGPLRVRSVVELAYDELRARIVDGRLQPGARIGQAELADGLGISRGSVREALRRLAGDGLVVFEVNRGFFVADVGLERVLERLEARLLLEPGIARLAAERRDDADLGDLRRWVDAERSARTAAAAHDASRGFHAALAGATHNEALVRIFDSLWIADVGRRLLASRRAQPTWQDADVAEHEELLETIEAGDGDRAASLMRAHVESAWRHWSRRPSPAASDGG
ncbi:MAG TPA: GntR family transcriptional regulator [Gaiella sp.]|jgi:DNA-binding GntR family transcriptional regulator